MTKDIQITIYAGGDEDVTLFLTPAIFEDEQFEEIGRTVAKAVKHLRGKS